MQLELLPSTVGSAGSAQYATTYLLNGSLALDAGTLGFWESPARQAKIRDIVLTHAHLDHLASLPMFLDQTMELADEPARIYSTAALLQTLRSHIFNGAIWPDFFELKIHGRPIIEWHELEPEVATSAAGLRITPISVDHSVPTIGLIVNHGSAAIAFTSDTGPTEEFWRFVNRQSGLAAVVIEASFPNRMQSLAQASGHMWVHSLRDEVAKMTHPIPVLVTHLKPQYEEEVAAELAQLNLPNLERLEMGRVYEF